jgi:hypothetical protein
MRKVYRIVLVALCMFGVFVPCFAFQQRQKKVESWMNMHTQNLKLRFEEYKEFGRRVRKAGYTTMVIRFTSPVGYYKGLAGKLIEYYKNDLGFKVIPACKLLGKNNLTFGKKFVKDHPALFVGRVLDPYAKYKGKATFDSLIIPVIDEHIKMFDNPKYFMLGWDEYYTDNIKKIADRNGKTVSEVWAGTLNRVTDYLLSKGITPIIGGDQLISKELAKEGNVIGYPADKRFKKLSSVHGAWPAKAKTDVSKFVKDIRNRDKIVVTDWHYENEKEYPSIEYFKWLGFKEIIPMTWGKDGNMKYFGKYAQDRGITKMMASVWHYSFHRDVRHLLWPVVENSILYFKNPDMKIPGKPKIRVLKAGKPVIFARPGESITLSMSPVGKDVEFEVYPIQKALRKNLITIKGSKWKIPVDIKEGLWVIQGYSKRKDGYLLHGEFAAGLYISKKRHLEKRGKSSFISADFSKCAKFGNRNQYILLDGTSETNFGIIEGGAVVRGGVFVCKDGGMRVGRSNFDYALMGKDKTVMLEFKLNKFPGEKEKWAGVLTWGLWGKGLRIIVWRKKLHIQVFGKENRKIDLVSKDKLVPGKKYLAVFNMNTKTAALYLNGKLQDKKTALKDNKFFIVSTLAVGSSISWKKKIWKCFDGTICRFAIWNKYVDEKVASK